MDSTAIATDQQEVLATLDGKKFKTVDMISVDASLSREDVVERLESLKNLGLIQTETACGMWRLTPAGFDALGGSKREAEPEPKPKTTSPPSGESRLLTIDPEFRSLIPPLTENERSQLEANIKRDGCIDDIRAWPSMRK